jgi:predicted glutamine amidotransferase
MCRLFAMTSETPVSPMIALEAMDVMREGHDGSGVGLFLRDLGGPSRRSRTRPSCPASSAKRDCGVWIPS